MPARKDSRRVSAARRRLIEEMDLAGREVSASTIVFHTAVADRQGLSPTDTKALDATQRRGPLTHADLVAETGLAPASVTELVDRLERKGYLARTPHPTDKRRSLVIADDQRIQADMAPMFRPWIRQLHALYTDYTDDELSLICDFLRRAAGRQRQAAEALHRANRTGSGRRPSPQR